MACILGGISYLKYCRLWLVYLVLLAILNPADYDATNSSGCGFFLKGKFY